MDDETSDTDENGTGAPHGAPGDKWILEVSADDSVVDVARRTLRNRLGAVLYYLPLAAERAEKDDEYVHQLRVWTRRARAALALYEDWLPRRRSAWMLKQLKRVRRAANDARDCDVLMRRLHGARTSRARARWLESVRAERAAAQQAVRAVHERLAHDERFARRVAALVDRVRTPRADGSGKVPVRFAAWARTRLPAAVDAFFAAVPPDPTDAAALHQFRIRGKELRYAMELLAGAFPEAFRTRLYPGIEALQDRLGDINDLATATTRLQAKISAAEDAAELAGWRRLLAREHRHLTEARQAFWTWCSPAMLRELREGFDAALTDPPASLDRSEP